MEGSSPSELKDAGSKFENPVAIKERWGDNFQVRDGDVFVNTYSRSGTNWMCYVLTQMYDNWGLVNYKDRTIVPMLDYYYRPRPKEGFMKTVQDVFLRTANELSPPRLVKTHLTPTLMPRSWKDNDCKVIYIRRNLKDVCVSFFYVILGVSDVFKLPKESWEGFPQRFIQGKVAFGGSPLQHIASWSKYGLKDNVLHITFEDMKENLPDVIKKVADFLGRPLSEEDIQRVVEESSIEKMRKNVWKILDFDSKDYQTAGDHQFIGKGKIGNWKHYFTVAESEQFDELMKAEMEKQGIDTSYEY
ncbi:sulfotransferase 1E1-like [Glandiceps talaboti]